MRQLIGCLCFLSYLFDRMNIFKNLNLLINNFYQLNYGGLMEEEYILSIEQIDNILKGE